MRRSNKAQAQGQTQLSILIMTLLISLMHRVVSTQTISYQAMLDTRSRVEHGVDGGRAAQPISRRYALRAHGRDDGVV